MNNNKIFTFVKEHEKYVILIGIYLTCLILSAVFDPYVHSWTDSDWLTGEEYEVSVNAEEYFYQINFGGDLTFKEKLSPLKLIGARLLTLGTADILNVFTWIGSHDRKEITMVVFPILAALKFILMKKYFSRKKDPLKRSWRNILYYSSENFLCDIAADTVTFYLAGVLTVSINNLCDAVVASHGYAFKDASDILFAVLLIPCFIPYKVTDKLVALYDETITYDIPRAGSGLPSQLLHLFCILLVSLVFLLLFELSMRLLMKPLDIAYESIKRIRRQKKKQSAADTAQNESQSKIQSAKG